MVRAALNTGVLSVMPQRFHHLAELFQFQEFSPVLVETLPLEMYPRSAHITQRALKSEGTWSGTPALTTDSSMPEVCKTPEFAQLIGTNAMETMFQVNSSNEWRVTKAKY